jgi:hypothetical protein
MLLIQPYSASMSAHQQVIANLSLVGLERHHHNTIIGTMNAIQSRLYKKFDISLKFLSCDYNHNEMNLLKLFNRLCNRSHHDCGGYITYQYDPQLSGLKKMASFEKFNESPRTKVKTTIYIPLLLGLENYARQLLLWDYL